MERILNQINFYCDESCHIQNDGNPVMSLATVYCSKVRVKTFNEAINSIKEKHKINKFSEIKWNKVSNCNLDFYKDLITYVGDNNLLKVRIIIAKHKDQIKDNDAAGSYDEWYSKMYYYLFKFPIKYIESYGSTYKYNFYIDKKDSHSVINNKELSKYLWFSFNNKEFVSHTCDSKEHILIQMADIIAGAAAYYYRDEKKSAAKIELMNYIQEKLDIDFSKSSPLKQKNSNLFIWNGRDFL